METYSASVASSTDPAAGRPLRRGLGAKVLRRSAIAGLTGVFGLSDLVLAPTFRGPPSLGKTGLVAPAQAATKAASRPAAAVPAAGAPPAAGATTAAVPDGVALPEQVAAMREAILAAARSGDVEALRTPLEWNEIRPDVAATPVADPVAHWRTLSADGQGREIMAVLVQLLEATTPAVVGSGTSARYVWPAVAETDLTRLTPAQEVQVYRLVSPASLRTMRERRAWTWYRLIIGADGTWHAFLKTD